MDLTSLEDCLSKSSVAFSTGKAGNFFTDSLREGSSCLGRSFMVFLGCSGLSMDALLDFLDFRCTLVCCEGWLGCDKRPDSYGCWFEGGVFIQIVLATGVEVARRRTESGGFSCWLGSYVWFIMSSSPGIWIEARIGAKRRCFLAKITSDQCLSFARFDG